MFVCALIWYLVREPKLPCFLTEIPVDFRVILKAQHNSRNVCFGPSCVAWWDQGTHDSVSDWAASCELRKEVEHTTRTMSGGRRVGNFDVVEQVIPADSGERDDCG